MSEPITRPYISHEESYPAHPREQAAWEAKLELRFANREYTDARDHDDVIIRHGQTREAALKAARDEFDGYLHDFDQWVKDNT